MATVFSLSTSLAETKTPVFSFTSAILEAGGSPRKQISRYHCCLAAADFGAA